MSNCLLFLSRLLATRWAVSLRSAPLPAAILPSLPLVLSLPSLVTTSAPFGNPQDSRPQPVSEEGVTAHPIVVSDSPRDDGPEYLEGLGVEDQRSALHPGATEGACRPGIAPGHWRAQESRTNNSMRTPALAALDAADLRKLARALARNPEDRRSLEQAPAPDTPIPDAVAGIRSPDFPGERLVACLNPRLDRERRHKRQKFPVAIEVRLENIAAPLPAGTMRGKAETGHRLSRSNVENHFETTIGETSVS